jgi:hypothetical protein
MVSKLKYPSNWKRVTKVIRRVAGCCEQCGYPYIDSVHHVGAPYADGTPGNPRDKHDLRRENLVALCVECHDAIDHIKAKRHTDKKRKQRRREKLETHRSLGIGTGLIPYGL